MSNRSMPSFQTTSAGLWYVATDEPKADTHDLLQMYFLGVITTLVTVAAVSPIFIVFFALMCIAYLQ